MLKGCGGIALMVGVQREHGVFEGQQQASTQTQERERRGGNGQAPFHAGPENAGNHLCTIDGGGIHIIDLALQLHVVQRLAQVEYRRHCAR
ncbi:hypothetical protein D3C80_1753600 [compost metagenome]